jgi:hypothetical protein
MFIEGHVEVLARRGIEWNESDELLSNNANSCFYKERLLFCTHICTIHPSVM